MLSEKGDLLFAFRPQTRLLGGVAERSPNDDRSWSKYRGRLTELPSARRLMFTGNGECKTDGRW